MKSKCESPYGWFKKRVTYANISPKMVNLTNIAGNTEEEDTQACTSMRMRKCTRTCTAQAVWGLQYNRSQRDLSWLFKYIHILISRLKFIHLACIILLYVDYDDTYCYCCCTHCILTTCNVAIIAFVPSSQPPQLLLLPSLVLPYHYFCCSCPTCCCYYLRTDSTKMRRALTWIQAMKHSPKFTFSHLTSGGWTQHQQTLTKNVFGK